MNLAIKATAKYAISFSINYVAPRPIVEEI